MDYALDTNIIIHLMSGTPEVKQSREKAQNAGARFIIPPIVDYEITRGLLIKQIKRHEAAYNIILDNCTLGEMTASAWKQAARIYADLYTKHFTVADADILIAAFCIAEGYTLVTGNTKDFQNMDGLKLVNWTM